MINECERSYHGDYLYKAKITKNKKNQNPRQIKIKVIISLCMWKSKEIIEENMLI